MDVSSTDILSSYIESNLQNVSGRVNLQLCLMWLAPSTGVDSASLASSYHQLTRG